METPEQRRARLRKASAESAAAADALLSDELAALKRATANDLEELRPQVQDPEAFDKLIAAVAASTRANESKAELRKRLSGLGQAVVATAKVVAGLLQ